ncbi:MAG TPA: hypothetical protein VGH95_07555 [Candidatus Aquirickettsiella sp.]
MQQTESSLREGRHFKITEAKRHTLAQAIDRYMAAILPTSQRVVLAKLRNCNGGKKG